MRNLTDDDVEAIVTALANKQHSIACRFGHVDPKLLEQATLFYASWNESWADSKKMARRGFTILIFVFFLGIFWNGLTTGLTSKWEAILQAFK